MSDETTAKPKRTKSTATPEDRIINTQLAVLANTYCEKIRKHAPYEKLGVVRQMRNLLTKGITLDMMKAAVENYSKDEFTMSNDPRFRKNIRAFFNADNVTYWQKPLNAEREPVRRTSPPPRDFQLSNLDLLEKTGQ